MVWPLTWAVIIGTLPGVFVGAWVRIAYLPDHKNFKFFAGLVLLYIGVRLAWDALAVAAACAAADLVPELAQVLAPARTAVTSSPPTNLTE